LIVIKRQKKGVSLVIVITSLMILLVAAGLVIDTGIVVNAQADLQKQVETAALYGATALEAKKTGTIISVNTTNLNSYITQIFNLSKSMNFESTLVNIDISQAQSKAVAVKAEGYVPMSFLPLTGISVVKIEAQSAAMANPFYLSPDFPQTPTKGSVLVGTSAETDIRRPLGMNQSLSYDSSGNLNINYLYGSPDNRAISLGSGGYVMIRLPIPLIDEDGFDLYIKELGNMEGYFVFAGNDIDPNNPYVDETKQGSGISWTNISCTGTPEGENIATSAVGAYSINVKHLDGSTTTETRFFGSGYFDIGATCSNNSGNSYNKNIKAAKYLKIVDDNQEDGFLTDNPTVPAAIFGEHSSVTPGADIDAVGVLHHSRLIKYSEFNKDTDGDGLIDILEKSLGTNESNADTDGDTIKDGLEYSGWYDNAGAIGSIINNLSVDNINLTSPFVNEMNKKRTLFYY
jgi:Flp pilus assembly protein TadG